MIRGIGICIMVWLHIAILHAQIQPELPFVRQDLNYIDNHQNGLDKFFFQLQQLEEGKTRKVTIVHIGDSHLQADWFSGRFRLEMHKQFGSAGRGLVFPYRVAKTNSPPDIKSYSNVVWDTKRNISVSSPTMPIGVSGITIRTRQPDFMLALDIDDNEYNIDYSFNKITVFSEKGANSYDFVVSKDENGAQRVPVVPTLIEGVTYHTVQKGEWLGRIAKEHNTTIPLLMDWNGLSNNLIFPNQKLIVSKTAPVTTVSNRAGFKDFTVIDNSNELLSSHSSKVWLSKPVNKVYLRGKKTHIQQHEAMIHGISLENDLNNGILYHMIGVNGAQFKHYNASTYFMTQLKELHPDLIIVSLGTNETYDANFNVSKFYRELDTFVHDLEQTMPGSNILLTTPPDAYYARKYVNRRVHNAKNTLLSYAINNGHACWDFYDIMGGEGSILTWQQARLAQNDKLHLTKSGYEYQGKLLYEALLKGYQAYRSFRP